jgi:hypothetical protein
MKFAKLLEIQYRGFFFCRLATDPDPTDEQRGVSGYTMALVDEDPLDQVIRTQIDKKFARKNLREPAQRMKIKVGVKVRDVLFDGKSYPRAREALRGAKLYLEGENPPFPGPTFDSRNNIVGSDDNLMFVVNPFQLAIRGKDVSIHAVDYLNPAQPEQPIWQIEDPSTYSRRLPTSFAASSTAAMAAIRVFDGYAYFSDRRRFLAHRIAELEGELAHGAAPAAAAKKRAAIERRIQALRTRIFQLEFWGERVITKLAFQLTYGFNVNGPQSVVGEKLLGGKVDCSQPWPISFWFGGWDGDLLIGYMQGTLSMPFQLRA